MLFYSVFSWQPYLLHVSVKYLTTAALYISSCLVSFNINVCIQFKADPAVIAYGNNNSKCFNLLFKWHQVSFESQSQSY